jgi:hypothetical protein
MDAIDRRRAVDEFVVEPLVIPLTVLAGTGFTIEPGVYFSDFRVRTEINMIVFPDDATVTGPLQAGIVELG